MNDSDSDGVLRHEVPAGTGFRVALVAFGVGAIVLAVWELRRGVWPPNLLSVFFLLIIGGAFAVGVPAAWTGLFGHSLQWTVSQGRIEILMRNPFGARTRTIHPGQIADLRLHEHMSDDGPNNWSVLLRTIDGESFHSRGFGSRERAEQLRQAIEARFRG